MRMVLILLPCSVHMSRIHLLYDYICYHVQCLTYSIICLLQPVKVHILFMQGDVEASVFQGMLSISQTFSLSNNKQAVLAFAPDASSLSSGISGLSNDD